MLTEGHKNIAEDWEMFEVAVGNARPGDLPQLLRSLKGRTTPMPPPMPMDVVEAGSPGTFIKPIQSPSPVKKEPQEILIQSFFNILNYKYNYNSKIC